MPSARRKQAFRYCVLELWARLWQHSLAARGAQIGDGLALKRRHQSGAEAAKKPEQTRIEWKDDQGLVARHAAQDHARRFFSFHQLERNPLQHGFFVELSVRAGVKDIGSDIAGTDGADL